VEGRQQGDEDEHSGEDGLQQPVENIDSGTNRVLSQVLGNMAAQLGIIGPEMSCPFN
jgi:hypothetical protein